MAASGRFLVHRRSFSGGSGRLWCGGAALARRRRGTARWSTAESEGQGLWPALEARCGGGRKATFKEGHAVISACVLWKAIAGDCGGDARADEADRIPALHDPDSERLSRR